MKNIFKISLIAIFTAILWSCEENDEIQFVTNEVAGPELITPNSSVVLQEDFEDNLALTIAWDDADYDIQTPITYNIEVDASGNSFANPIPAGSTKERVYSWTVKQLNDAALAAGLKADEEGALDIRVKSSIGTNNGKEMISNVSIVAVTPYEAFVAPVGGPEFFMVGNFQKYYEAAEWTPTEAIRMKHIGSNDEELIFEAFVKLEEGNGFKFINEPIDWGDLESNLGTIGGAQDGNLENSGGSSDIKAPETGLYYVKLDVANLKYEIAKMDWGIIGDGTPGGWDGETAMTYDFENNKFTLSTGLTDGQLKFRAKNAGNIIFPDDDNTDWKFNVGSGEDPTGNDQSDGNFDVSSGGFDLELSFDFLGNATISGL